MGRVKQCFNLLQFTRYFLIFWYIIVHLLYNANLYVFIFKSANCYPKFFINHDLNKKTTLNNLYIY